MNYRETLLFVGKCLTLGCYPERRAEIQNTIRSGVVKWERVVWVSTNQFVFPALYLQLERAGLLPELPADLVEYMEEFTSVNRERNRQIIDQADEIAALLNQHDISPVFLKGTAHLLDGLYEDFAERMVGDIDLLVDEKEMVRAAGILIQSGYEPIASYDKNFRKVKHYPRLKNASLTAAVEIHRQILQFPAFKELDYRVIAGKCRELNRQNLAFVPCDEHQILHNILNVQLNDYGYYYAKIFLRQQYDLMLLSQKEDPLRVVSDFGRFSHQMNANLALTNLVLGNPDSIQYKQNRHTRIFIRRINRNMKHPRWEHFSGLFLCLLLKIRRDISMLAGSIFNRETRISVGSRLSNPRWYWQHLKTYRKIG